MKVFCINDNGWIKTKRYFWGLFKRDKNTTGPSYGDTCTVTDEEWEEGIMYYSLLEWPEDEFQSDCFIPISEQEEEVAAEIQILELTK